MTQKRTQQNPDEEVGRFKMPTVEEILRNSEDYWAVFNKAWKFMNRYRFPPYLGEEFSEYMKFRIGTQKGIIRTRKRYIDHAIRGFVEEQKRSGKDQEAIYSELKGHEIMQLQERYKTLFSLMRKYSPEKKPGHAALKKLKNTIKTTHTLDDSRMVG